MRNVIWICADLSHNSAELRRLVLPALLVEEQSWTSKVFTVDTLSDDLVCDVVVVSANALAALARVVAWEKRPAILVELDDATVQNDATVLDSLTLSAGRFDAVVARGPLSAAWANDVLSSRVAHATICDIADRTAELDAAALRFSLSTTVSRKSARRWPAYWFAEPGDCVTEEEMFHLLALYKTDPALAVLAPTYLLEWLRQLTEVDEERLFLWSANAIDHVLSSRRTKIALYDGDNVDRRWAKCARHGTTVPSGVQVQQYSPEAIGLQWSEILQTHSIASNRPSIFAPPNVLLFLDLIQDIPLALPIIDAALEERTATLRIVISNWLADERPQVLRELESRGIKAEIHDRRMIVNGAAPSLEGVDALLTIVETTLNPHRRSHMLTLRAQSLAIPTFTLQHGFENVALTYFDEIHDGQVDIHSDHVFVWFPVEETPRTVPNRIRPRLMHVGRPRVTQRHDHVRDLFAGQRVVSVFENLHWHRYNRAFRDRFSEDLFSLARAFSDRTIVLKPHPAGQWTIKAKDTFSDWPSNLILADPNEEMWSSVSADSVISASEAVITTPSSIVVDAVQLRRPVAIAGYDLDLSLYKPLPILRRIDDWINFVSSSQNSLRAAQIRADFVSRSSLPGTPEREIVRAIAGVVQSRLQRTLQ